MTSAQSTRATAASYGMARAANPSAARANAVAAASGLASDPRHQTVEPGRHRRGIRRAGTVPGGQQPAVSRAPARSPAATCASPSTLMQNGGTAIPTALMDRAARSAAAISPRPSSTMASHTSPMPSRCWSLANPSRYADRASRRHAVASGNWPRRVCTRAPTLSAAATPRRMPTRWPSASMSSAPVSAASRAPARKSACARQIPSRISSAGTPASRASCRPSEASCRAAVRSPQPSALQ